VSPKARGANPALAVDACIQKSLFLAVIEHLKVDRPEVRDRLAAAGIARIMDGASGFQTGRRHEQ
jgi:hypothetical protein